MQIYWSKTMIKNLGTHKSFPNVVVDGNLVDREDEFTYLGSLQSSDG